MSWVLYAAECLDVVRVRELQVIEKKEQKNHPENPWAQVSSIVRQYRLRSQKKIYSQTEKITHSIRKRRVIVCDQLERLDPSRFNKQIFDIFDQRPITSLSGSKRSRKICRKKNQY